MRNLLKVIYRLVSPILFWIFLIPFMVLIGYGISHYHGPSCPDGYVYVHYFMGGDACVPGVKPEY